MKHLQLFEQFCSANVEHETSTKLVAPLDEAVKKSSSSSTALKNKSEASGISVGILRSVFSKGMKAWNSGHRPGVSQHQWAMGRVNSFITGSGGARKADKELWARAKATKASKK